MQEFSFIYLLVLAFKAVYHLVVSCIAFILSCFPYHVSISSIIHTLFVECKAPGISGNFPCGSQTG
jgi:hypothetical protein